jgi:hypothetical protein
MIEVWIKYMSSFIKFLQVFVLCPYLDNNYKITTIYKQGTDNGIILIIIEAE